MGVKH